VHYVFEAQLKKIKKDELVNNQESWMMLKNYVSSVVLIMIKHYTKINVNRTQYEAITTTSDKRTEWRKPILIDLHNLDQQTADINVTCEGGTTVAKEINIRAFINW
jgi:ribosomal protein S9